MQFSEQLTTLRTHANYTNRQLADIANVPHSLIAGLQSGKRRVGENNARKIGMALGLHGKRLDDFIYLAIDNCSEKVLADYKPYPAELLNLLARMLRSLGITPERVAGYEVSELDVHLLLLDGKEVNIGMNISYS